jgi:hypothetical protein
MLKNSLPHHRCQQLQFYSLAEAFQKDLKQYLESHRISYGFLAATTYAVRYLLHMQQQLVLPDQQSSPNHEEPAERVLEPECKEPEHVPAREANAAVSTAAFSYVIELVETGVLEIGEAQVSVA